MSGSVPHKLASLERKIAQISRGQRLSHGASIENAAIVVKDDSGSLRTIVGLQGDGTTGVQNVNGPPPPQPSAPIVASVLGGVTVSWDGQFAGGAVIPMDWSRVEVHASLAPVYEPIPETLKTTIETAQGATVVVSCDDPVYVRLLARNLSGTASVASVTVGPFGPSPVVATDILDGIVTTVKLADDAVTNAKVAVGAIDADALANAAVTAAKIGANAVTLGKIAAGAVNLNTLTGPLADTASQRYADLFRDPAAWAQLSASSGGTWTINAAATDTPSGGGKLIATGDVQLASTALIPQDTDTLYRVMVRVRATAQDPTGPSTVYMGVAGVAEDGVTLVNRAGANSNATQHYCCTAGGTVATADGWKVFTGWIQGHSATGATAPAGPATDPRAPEQTHADVRYLRPMVWLNFGKATSAVMEVEAVTVEAIRTGVVGSSNLIAGSVTAGAIATDAVIAGKVAADAITAREITAGAINTAELAAGAVTANELAANSVIAGKIAATAVQAGNLAANSVQAGNVAADGIQAGNIAANAVTARELNALSVTAGKIATNAVTAGTIAAGAVTTNSLTVGIAQSIAQKITDAMGDASLWTQPADSGTWSMVSGVTDAAAGGTVIQASGVTSLERTTNTPFDPDALYKITARVRTTVAPTSGTPTVYIGLTGIAADGVTRVNRTGANSLNSQHYFAAAGLNIAVGTTWTTVTGYVQGTAATGTGSAAAPDPKAPGQMHSSVRYVRPLLRLLFGSTAGGTQQVDQVTLETVPTGVVNSVNIANGAVTANSLAADAITGKTITGGTITGSVLQTAASGQRITINEAAANKVIVYNSTGTAVGELSTVGVLLKGTNGSLMVLDPNATYPNLRMTNSSGSNQAVLNVVENNPGSANPGLNSGTFTGNGFTDLKWRLFMGEDFAVIERLRDSNNASIIGGRLDLRNTYGALAYYDSVTGTTSADITLTAGQAKLRGRFIAQPFLGDTTSVVYVQPGPSHTGPLLRLYNPDVARDRFLVDNAGNTTVDGILTAGNIATGSVTITPSAANTPTSFSLSGINVKGTTFTGFVTANTSVPAPSTGAGGAPNGVNSVAISSVTGTGATLWVNRQNTTNTTVNWMIVGS
ncbi:beta strand repeat-containing protein [Streptomyces sp. NPDC059916]|uniref:beta strand repeat-containing protein n=1 Tax=Streptomyces sp. NPDC059916 TaxID=3347001 RepID=UPI003698967A